MSYGSNVLAEYPTSYNQSTLPNIDINRRSTFENSYPPDNFYQNADPRFNQERTIHHRSSVSQNSSTTSSRKPIPPNQTAPLLNEIPKYEESLGTASSVARSMNNINIQQNHNQPTNNINHKPQSQPNRNFSQTKIQQQQTTRIQPDRDVNKGIMNGESNRNDNVNQSVNMEAWLGDTKKKSIVDEKSTKQAWTVKTDHMDPTQQNKSIRSKTKSKSFTNSINRDKTYEIQQDPYFDAVDDENSSPSFHQTTSTRTHLSTNSFHQASLNSPSRNPKTSSYEPPSPKRVPGTMPVNSWKRQDQLQFPLDSLQLDSSESEFTGRDNIHKNADERFHEALQKLRADRAKQQKELSETTAKRLQYGDYIRHSSKDELLQTVVKSPSGTDFLEFKKGNLLSLSKQEKKELYDQSRSYAERIRYRNYDKWHENEIAKSLQKNALQKDAYQESESSNLTPRQKMKNAKSKSVNRTLKQHGSDLTTKTTKKMETKQRLVGDSNRIKTNENLHTSFVRDHRLDEEYGKYPAFISNHKKIDSESKKKRVRYAKYDSVGRETSGVDDNADNYARHTPRTMHLKLRQVSSNLYSLEEEKPFDDVRYKRR
ncbi:hypothetical protein I4U23_029648 [Adineta vaga]|nr:hypothetical protein I4U23_029648 [Adineta vaga]